MFTKRDFQFPKPYRIVKGEKYETFQLYLQAILRQKLVAGDRHGNYSLVVPRVSPGRVIDVLL